MTAPRDGARWSSTLDEDSERFEAELLARRRADGSAVELPLAQRHVWLRAAGRELRLMQLRDAAGAAAMQAAVHLERPRGPRLITHAVASKLGEAFSPADEIAGLRALRDLCSESGDVTTLRLAPRRTTARALWDFEARARRLGFQPCEAEGITRTLLVDLARSPDEILAGLSKKTRVNVRAGGKLPLDLRALDDDAYRPACEAAVAAAVDRTGCRGRVHLAPAFAVARARPDLVRIVGLFLRERPRELLAFVIGHRHGAHAEYTTGGSLFDPALRKIPFNYLLLWELMMWARQHGSTAFDLGGITDGDADDPLAGVSAFKRHIGGTEIETGRELRAILQPRRYWAYAALRGLRDRLR